MIVLREDAVEIGRNQSGQRGNGDHTFGPGDGGQPGANRIHRQFQARPLSLIHISLIQLGAIEDLPEPERSSYQEGVRQAAREAGTLYLTDCDIPHAWPYFRAIGDRETIASAIGAAEMGEQIEALIDIALGERVHPPKGLQLVIAQHGICRAITYFEQFPDLEQREECLILLVRTLHAELVANLKSAIVQREGQAPGTNSILELMAARDWLFGEFDAYIDTSHVINVVRFAVDRCV